MAPLPASNTGRVYIDYTVGGEEHTVTSRFLSISSSAALCLAGWAEIFAFLSPNMFAITSVSSRFSVINSDVTNPITWPGSLGYGADQPPVGQEMKFFSMVGKSQDGRRVRYELFGSKQAIPSSWRLPVGSNLDMDDARAHLQAMHVSGATCTISGGAALLNPYYNFKYADLEIDKARG